MRRSFAKARYDKFKIKEKQIEVALDVFSSRDSMASLRFPSYALIDSYHSMKINLI